MLLSKTVKICLLLIKSIREGNEIDKGQSCQNPWGLILTTLSLALEMNGDYDGGSRRRGGGSVGLILSVIGKSMLLQY